jgi:hypothetical protein
MLAGLSQETHPLGSPRRPLPDTGCLASWTARDGLRQQALALDVARHCCVEGGRKDEGMAPQ